MEWLPSRIPPPTNFGEDIGKRNPHTLLVGMYISRTTVENGMEAS
jgi:hypothetical protein